MRLRTRLYAGLGAIAVAFAITGYLVATTQQRYLTEQVDRELQSSMPVALGVLGNRPLPVPPEDTVALSKLWVGHLTPDGTLSTVVQGQDAVEQPAITTSMAQQHGRRNNPEPFTVDGNVGDERFRVLVLERPGAGVTGWEVIALSLNDTDDAYQRLLLATGVGGIAVLAVIALIAAWVVRLGVKPINEMTEAYNENTIGNLKAPPGQSEADAVDAIVRPHPLAVGGTPTRLHYQLAERVMRFTWDTTGPDGTQSPADTESVFQVAPRTYPKGYKVLTVGATVTSPSDAASLTVVADGSGDEPKVVVYPADAEPPSLDFPEDQAAPSDDTAPPPSPDSSPSAPDVAPLTPVFTG